MNTKIASVAKRFICAISVVTCISMAHAADSTNLVNVQTNYQSAINDLNIKQNMVTQSTDDVTTAENKLEKAKKNLQQAQKDLADADTSLKQKKAALVKAKQDLVISTQNKKVAADAVNQAWKNKAK